jgi:hypothetical protein
MIFTIMAPFTIRVTRRRNEDLSHQGAANKKGVHWREECMRTPRYGVVQRYGVPAYNMYKFTTNNMGFSNDE